MSRQSKDQCVIYHWLAKACLPSSFSCSILASPSSLEQHSANCRNLSCADIADPRALLSLSLSSSLSQTILDNRDSDFTFANGEGRLTAPVGKQIPAYTTYISIGLEQSIARHPQISCISLKFNSVCSDTPRIDLRTLAC